MSYYKRAGLLQRVWLSFKQDNLVHFMQKIFYYLHYKLRLFYLSCLPDAEAKFTRYYKANYWGSKESPSGPCAELKNTENIRKYLPKIIEQYKIKTIFDAPCGDFNWMQHVLTKANIEQYIGGDIVPQLITTNNQKFSSDKIKFIKMDITKDQLPTVDLIIVRGCLPVLSNKDIELFLANFYRSNIKYLLTSTYPNPNRVIGNFINTDIPTASFRHLDLFSSPFNFNKQDVMETIQDDVGANDDQVMVLFAKENVPRKLSIV